jgi:hypothetical protein
VKPRPLSIRQVILASIQPRLQCLK